MGFIDPLSHSIRIIHHYPVAPAKGQKLLDFLRHSFPLFYSKEREDGRGHPGDGNFIETLHITPPSTGTPL